MVFSGSVCDLHGGKIYFERLKYTKLAINVGAIEIH